MSKIFAALAVAFGLAATAQALVALHPKPTSAPEIDPAVALAALSLLAGGLAVVRGRRKK